MPSATPTAPAAAPLPMPATPAAPVSLRLPDRHLLKLTVNGVAISRDVEAWTSLLDFLRQEIGLTGTKKGCDHGQCGACTVLLDGRRINACLTLAVMNEGATVVTVEGLADGAALHPLQQAFIAHDAFQCGYCTPGQLCSAAGLLAEGGVDGVDVVRERMSGNLCRCGAYAQITAAVCEVAGIAHPRAVIEVLPAPTLVPPDPPAPPASAGVAAAEPTEEARS